MTWFASLYILTHPDILGTFITKFSKCFQILFGCMIMPTDFAYVFAHLIMSLKINKLFHSMLKKTYNDQIKRPNLYGFINGRYDTGGQTSMI